MEGTTKMEAQAKLILFPMPLEGHVTPMLHLANLLYSKSFSITIIQTRYNSINPTRFPHFTFHFVEDTNNPLNTQFSTNTVAPGLKEIREYANGPFKACLTRVLSEAKVEKDPFACLITDSLWFFAGDVADELNIPRIILRTSSMSAFRVNNSLPVFKDKGYFLPGIKPDETVNEIPPFKIRDLPSEAHHDLLASVVQQTKTAHAVICNSFEDLEGPSITNVRNILSIPLFPIGPLHKHSATSAASIRNQDLTSITWLNTQSANSVLYVSFGSVATMTKTDFLEIAWGLANSNHPFLWVVRPGLSQDTSQDELFPKGYLDLVKERGRIVKWAPQVDVLAHPAVGGFFTHCGWNSTIEGVSEGVPMICLPFFADQAMNARYVNDVWKIGMKLESGIKRDYVENAIKKLMGGVEGEGMREKAKGFKDCAIECLKEGGSSFSSLESVISYILAL